MTCNLSETISPAFAESHRAVKAGTINELVEKGGRGSCKSSYISLEIILLILKNPLIHACVFRKYGNTLRATVHTGRVGHRPTGPDPEVPLHGEPDGMHISPYRAENHVFRSG